MTKKTNLVKKLWKGYLIVSTVYTGIAFLNCRGLGKEDDRHLIGKAIDRLAGYNKEPDRIIIIDDTEMHVSYNPYMQLFTNSLGGIAVVINGTTEVYTDIRFRGMSDATQYAILCHELGHYKHKHNGGITYAFDRLIAIKNKTVLPMELEADMYACSIVGKRAMISALLELKSYLKGYSSKEIELRIKAIMKGGEL